MPAVQRWGPYRAFFYSNEGGEPPHVHVRGEFEPFTLGGRHRPAAQYR
jgi:hypothetical protein